MVAHIHQINVSDGGVPKLAVDSPAVVHSRGVTGDRQNDMKHHGSVDQALCLYSLEVIEALQAEGHPITPGATGENITIAGLDWTRMLPGLRLRFGTDVIAEVTWPATPCAKNAKWFTALNYRRMSQELHPGWSRWYAKVVTGGVISPGDPVEIQPQ
jgi:MOSC domain-containing protein YiiM